MTDSRHTQNSAPPVCVLFEWYQSNAPYPIFPVMKMSLNADDDASQGEYKEDRETKGR